MIYTVMILFKDDPSKCDFIGNCKTLEDAKKLCKAIESGLLYDKKPDLIRAVNYTRLFVMLNYILENYILEKE
jgi:hypothetical protein